MVQKPVEEDTRLPSKTMADARHGQAAVKGIAPRSPAPMAAPGPLPIASAPAPARPSPRG